MLINSMEFVDLKCDELNQINGGWVGGFIVGYMVGAAVGTVVAPIAVACGANQTECAITYLSCIATCAAIGATIPGF